MISVVIADDHALVRQGLSALLEAAPQVQVVGEAGDGGEAIALVERLLPDVLLLDFMMPGWYAPEVIRRVLSASRRTRVLVLSMYANEAFVVEALQSGATGYVLKGATGSDLIDAIQRAAGGCRYLSAPLTDLVIDAYIKRAGGAGVDPYDALTARERQVLHLAAEGLTNTEIASLLFISPRTVESHRARVLRKLHLQSQTDVVRYALKRGLIASEP